MQFTNKLTKIAVDKKPNDKSHLDKFDVGTLTSSDFEGNYHCTS